MAEPNAPDAAAALPGGVADDPKGGGKKKILLLLLPLLLVSAGGGGYLAYAYYPQMATVAAYVGLFSTGEEEQDPDAPIEYGQFHEVRGLVVNPAGSDGSRYLMVHIGFESSSEAVITELTDKDVVMRDTILKLLGEETVASLADISQRTRLKEALREAVNEILSEGEVQRLYFTQYVLQ